MRFNWLVYWLYDDTCRNYREDGCVGATRASRIFQRLNQHRKSKRIPKDFRYEIIFRGPQKAALAFEAQLRPRPYIGWNIGVGGFANGGGGKGIPKSSEHREKQRQAALRRYQDPAERARTAAAVKRAFKDIDRSGPNNSHFGKPHSEESKALISRVKREKAAARKAL
jgi:hypothetical protein